MKTILYLPLLFLAANSLFAQSNIQHSLSVNTDGSAPNASAQLDVSATDKGMLVPRMTSAQRTAIASPATGLLVFDTNSNTFWFYNGTAWSNLSSSSGIASSIADADNDTKVQVEEIPNEDIIRFDLGGTESMVLQKNSSGSQRLELPNALSNTFIGQDAGNATSGNQNTAIGYNALFSSTTGHSNTVLGYKALFNNLSGFSNTALGGEALYLNTTGYANTGTGNFALYYNITGHLNTANGHAALYSNTTGNKNTAQGSYALHLNTTGNFNTANGNEALYSNTTGNSNNAIGNQALYSNTTGLANTANGYAALYFNTTGSANTADGHTALYSNTIGNFNTANGNQALYSNTIGDENTAIGRDALFSNTSGFYNTAIGAKTLYANTSGGSNTAIGRYALSSNTSSSNTACGAYALSDNTTGFGNTATGDGGLYFNTTGYRNTASGSQALTSNTTGNDNTAIGFQALYYNVNGSNNTALGYGADVSSGGLTNATAIGKDATANASNKVRIGNTNVTVIEGQVDWTFPSDARFKFNVHDENVPGLAFINQLRPVTYQLDTRKFDKHLMQNMPDSVQQQRLAGKDYSKSTAKMQTGFLAQEVEEVCKKLGYEFSGLHVPESEVDNYGLAYGSFVPLLVKGMQEQQAIIQSQTEKIEAQEAEIGRLKKLETQLDKITAALATMSGSLGASAGIAVEK
jgi:hypothetical protein